MLSHLFKVNERVPETSTDCSHSSQARSLELFALVERLRILDESHIVPCNRFNEGFGSVHLPKCDAKVVGVV